MIWSSFGILLDNPGRNHVKKEIQYRTRENRSTGVLDMSVRQGKNYNYDL
jgi:hypothetical protein